MPSLLQLARLSLEQMILPQTLLRTPEPKSVMDDEDNVDDFDNIMQTNVAISLCGAIELLAHINAIPCNSALDVACGPGHFTLLLAKYANIEKVVGVDLSEPMLEKARKNARVAGLEDRVEFIQGDATALGPIREQEFDLVTCTNSAHHMPTYEHLRAMLWEISASLSRSGIAMIMDLTRLRSLKTLDRYVREMGNEYLERDLNRLFDDFNNSMHAAWSPKEFQEATKTSSTHHWNYFSINPLPVNQFLLAYPRVSKQEISHPKFCWPSDGPPIRKDLKKDFIRYRKAMLTARRTSLSKTNQSTRKEKKAP